MPIREDIFKEGTHTDANGNTRTFTKQDLLEMASLYNNQPESERHVAPLVLGHPDTEQNPDLPSEMQDPSAAPALARVSELTVENDENGIATLYATIDKPTPAYTELINQNYYYKKSAAFYTDGKLRHVAMLGGNPPAIKGLSDLTAPEFKDGDRKYFVYADAIPASAALQTQTPDISTNGDLAALIAAQTERSKKYGIEANADEGGTMIEKLRENLTKPATYANLADEQFADPVNYQYPINDVPNILASLRTFDNWRYSNDSRQLVLSRILTAAIANGIDVNVGELNFADGRKAYVFNEVKKAGIEFTSVKQQSRSYAYGIKVQADQRNEKPAEYSELKDHAFADPVHYKYPIDSKHIVATIGSWNRDSAKSNYSEKEKAIIQKRVVSAALEHKVNITPYKWIYGEALSKMLISGKHIFKQTFSTLPSEKGKTTKLRVYADGAPSPVVTVNADMLSKPQILKVLAQIQNTPNTITDNSQPFEEVNMAQATPGIPLATTPDSDASGKMMMESQFDQFVADLVSKVNEQYQTDIGTGVGAIIEGLKTDAKYWTTDAQEDASDIAEQQQGVTASEPLNSQTQTYAERLKYLENKLALSEEKERIQGVDIFCEGTDKEGITLPKQRNLIHTAFQAVKDKQGLQFAESDGKIKKMSGEEVLKALIKSFPKQIEFGESPRGFNPKDTKNTKGITLPDNLRFGEFADDDMLFNETQKVVAEYAEKGKKISAYEAVDIAQKRL